MRGWPGEERGESESEELEEEEEELEEEEDEDAEEREGSGVEALVSVEEELWEGERGFRRRGWRRRLMVGELDGVEDVDEVSEEEEGGERRVLRFLHRASAARRPTAVEMMAFMVIIFNKRRRLGGCESVKR